jgi:hypothetical protein
LITGCDIMVNFQGSDHAPVWADLAIPLAAMPAGHAVPPSAASKLFPAKQQTIKLWLQPKQQRQQLQQQQQHWQQLSQQAAAAGMQAAPQANSAGCQPLPSTCAPSEVAAAPGRIGGAMQLAQTSSRGASSGSGKSGSTVGKRRSDSQAAAGVSSKRGQRSLLGLGFKRQASQQAAQQPAAAVVPDQVVPAAVVVQQEASALQSQQQQPQQPEQFACQQLVDFESSQAVADDALQARIQKQRSQQEAQGASSASHGAAAVEQALQQHQQEASAAWQRISQKMQPPKCNCKEPSVVRVSKKQNENYLRQFYTCARPAGPPGIGRCNFFQWATAPKVKPKAAGHARAAGVP